MKTVFLLQHSYDYECDCGNGITAEETKILGIFSTKEKAETAVLFYKTLPGFKDFPDDCFYISECELDKREWTEGFE